MIVSLFLFTTITRSITYCWIESFDFDFSWPRTAMVPPQLLLGIGCMKIPIISPFTLLVHLSHVLHRSCFAFINHLVITDLVRSILRFQSRSRSSFRSREREREHSECVVRMCSLSLNLDLDSKCNKNVYILYLYCF